MRFLKKQVLFMQNIVSISAEKHYILWFFPISYRTFVFTAFLHNFTKFYRILSEPLSVFLIFYRTFQFILPKYIRTSSYCCSQFLPKFYRTSIFVCSNYFRSFYMFSDKLQNFKISYQNLSELPNTHTPS